MDTDKKIPLKEVPAYLKTKHGVARHFMTIHRWTTAGCGGEILDFTKIGRTRMVSLRQLEAFCSWKF
jgi:hypothetical protein